MPEHVPRSLVALGLLLVCLTLALGQPRLVSQGWIYKVGATGLLADEFPITGFAFCPGRNEVAFTAPAKGTGRFALRVTQAAVPPPRDLGQPMQPMASSRLLWTAPAGTTLRGPIRWSRNGARIALLAYRDESPDLVVVDYATGDPTWVTRGERVTDVAWQPSANRLAYVTEADGPALVWLQTFPPTEPRGIGTGGINLHWTPDGKALRWLEPTSLTAWTEMILDVGSGEVRRGNSIPPRPPGTIWSPDGRFCAWLQESGEPGAKHLVIARSESPTGQAAPLPGLTLTRLLNWAPDGNLVLVLDSKNWLYAVSAEPADPALLAILPLDCTKERATTIATGVSPVGPPSWSPSGHLLAYVMTDESDPEFAWVKKSRRPIYEPFGRLVVVQVARRYIGSGPQTERQQVFFNMEKIATAMSMYFTDYDRFFPVTDLEDIRYILDEYVGGDQSVFMRPGTTDEVIVRYLLPPNAGYRELFADKDPSTVEVAIVEYPTYTVIAYADGRVETFDKP